MSKTGRVTTQPLRPYMRLPEQSAAPIAAASTTNAMVFYTDGTSALVSIDAAAYTALALSSGATFTGLVTIDSSVAPTFSIDTDAVSGTIARIRHNVETTPTGALVGFSVDLATNWVAGNVNHTGVTIAIPATTVGAAAGVAALAIDSQATQAYSFDLRFANTTATVMIVRQRAATAPTGGLIGMDMDLTNTSGALSTNYSGIRILIPATTRASTAGEGALVISTDATAARAIDCDVANTSGTLAIIRYGAATTLTATALIGLDINLATNVTAATNDPPITGIAIRIPATDAAGAAGEAALFITSDATAARVIDIDIANTSADPGIIALRYGAATTLAGLTVGLSLDFNTNVTPGAVQINPLVIDMPATTIADAVTSAAVLVRSRATATRSLDIAVQNTSATGGVVVVRYNAATTLAGQVLGIECDLSTSVTPGANAVIGQRILIPATTRASTPLEGALVIASDATAARVIDIDIANTSADPGIITLRYGAATTLAGTTVGLSLDFNTNVTPGSLVVIPLVIDVPATTVADAITRTAILIRNRATAMRSLDVAVQNTSATGGVVVLRYNAATTLAGAVTMLSIDASTNVTVNGQVVTGINLVMADNTQVAIDVNAGFIQFNEMTAPAAGAADTARLYADVSGVKTRLMVIFQSGAAQQIGIEP